MIRLLLGALLAVLAAGVGLELADRDAAPPAPGGSPLASVPTPPAPAVLADRSPAEVQTVLARPLFAPNRRPPAGTAAVPAAAAAPTLPRVTGILMNGRQRSVIFAATGDARPLVVAEGGEVNGFRVQTIEDGQVTVVGPDGPRVLHPSFDPSPPASAAPRGPVVPQFPGLPGLPSLPGLPGIPGLPTLPPGIGQPEIAR